MTYKEAQKKAQERINWARKNGFDPLDLATTTRIVLESAGLIDNSAAEEERRTGWGIR